MIPEHLRKSNIGVGLGILFQILALLIRELWLLSLLLVLAGTVFFIWGCMQYSLAKGHSWAWGLLGFLSLIGLIILYFLPDRPKALAKGVHAIDTNQPNTKSHKRPIVLSIWCVFSVIVMSFTLVNLLFSPSFRSEMTTQLGVGYVLYSIFWFPVGIAALVGLWLMRRWGLYLYIVSTVVGYVVNWWLGISQNIGALFASLVVIGILLAYFKRFR